MSPRGAAKRKRKTRTKKGNECEEDAAPKTIPTAFSFPDVKCAGGGREDVIRYWQGLSIVDKKGIMELNPNDLIISLGKWCPEFFDYPLVEHLETVASDPQAITAIRSAFVDALENGGTLPDAVPRDPVILFIIQELDNHLLLAYCRFSTYYKLVAFALFWVFWLLEYNIIVRVAVLCVVWAFSLGNGFRKQEWKELQEWRHHICDPFVDEAPIFEARLDAVLCCCLGIRLSAHWFGSWYWLSLCVLALPLVLIEVEKRVPVEEHNALHLIRSGVSYLSFAVLLYLSYYSYITTLFVMCLLAPVMTKLLCVVFTAGGMFFFGRVEKLQEITRRRWRIPPRTHIKQFLLFGALLVLPYYWTRGSWWYWLPHMFVAFACSPRILIDVISTVLPLASALWVELGHPAYILKLAAALAPAFGALALSIGLKVFVLAKKLVERVRSRIRGKAKASE